MGRQRPASMTKAIRAQLALVFVSGLTTLLTVLRRDDLVRAWAGGQRADVDPPAFAPVAVVLFFTFALLVAVLLAFFRSGHGPARISLTLVALFYLFTMFVMYRQDPPSLFVVLAACSVVLDLAVLYYLWHPDTSAFLRGAGLASQRDS